MATAAAMELDMSSETACTHRDSSRMCKVEGCSFDLEAAGRYCWKRRICPAHMRADEVKCRDAGDSLWRFCHQCGKLEPLEKFEGAKRSCTASLLKRRSHDNGDCPATRSRRREVRAKRTSATISEGSVMPLPEEVLLSSHDMRFAESIATTLVEAMWEAAAAPDDLEQQQKQLEQEQELFACMQDEHCSQLRQAVQAVHDRQYNCGGNSSSRSYLSEPLPQLLPTQYSDSFNRTPLLHHNSSAGSAVQAVQPAVQSAAQFCAKYNESNRAQSRSSLIYDQQGISQLCNLLTRELHSTVGELGGLLQSQRCSLDCSTTNEQRDESATPGPDSCCLGLSHNNNSFTANNANQGNSMHGSGGTIDSSDSILMALLEQELRAAAAAVSEPLGSAGASGAYAATAAMMPAASGSAPLLQQLQPPACHTLPTGMTAIEASFAEHAVQLLGSGSCRPPAAAAAAAAAGVATSNCHTAPLYNMSLPAAATAAGLDASCILHASAVGGTGFSTVGVAAAAAMSGAAVCTSQLPLQARIAKLTLLSKLQQAQEVLNEIQELRQQAQQLENVMFLQ